MLLPSDDLGEEVKYSYWPYDPYSVDGECISIDAWNGRWRAANLTDKKKVVCQASEH